MIRSAHNGFAQVAQVVVCHALCAEQEIEWKAAPPSWQSPKRVCGKKKMCVLVCGKKKIDGVRMSQSLSTSASP